MEDDFVNAYRRLLENRISDCNMKLETLARQQTDLTNKKHGFIEARDMFEKLIQQKEVSP